MKALYLLLLIMIVSNPLKADPGDREYFMQYGLPTLHPFVREYMCQHVDGLIRSGLRRPRSNNMIDCEISMQEGWSPNIYLNDAKLNTEQNKVLIGWGKYCRTHSTTKYEYLGCMWRRGYQEID